MTVNGLPNGWATTTLGAVGDIRSGVGFPPALQGRTVGAYPLAKVGDVSRAVRSGDGTLGNADHWIDEADLRTLRARPLPPGSIVFAKIGESIRQNFRAITTRELVVDNNVMGVVPRLEGIEPRFLLYFLRTLDWYPLAVSTTVPSLRKTDLAAVTTPVPPLNEQRRIVAKLEALQSRSRRAREALDAVPPLLESLRQSILAAAFRGDLTKDWREKHPDVEPANLESGEAQRSQKKRLWGSGRTADGIDASWGELPPSWQWARVRDLNDDPAVTVQIGPMSMKSNEFEDSGNIVLNVGCVQRGHVEAAKANYLPVNRAIDFERYRLCTNDVLFTRSGTVGRCAMLPKELAGALMTFHLLRVRTSDARCVPTYLMFAFQGSLAVSAQVGASSVGATRAGFNTRLLEEMWIPLAPPAEQAELVRVVTELLGACSSMATRVELLQAHRAELDRSILAKAFRGELVPQDPNDEPAAVMLERVKSALGRTHRRGWRRADGASSSAADRADQKGPDRAMSEWS